jgi:hypothetical protein
MSKLRSDQPPAPSSERAYRDAYTALRSLVDDSDPARRPIRSLTTWSVSLSVWPAKHG